MRARILGAVMLLELSTVFTSQADAQGRFTRPGEDFYSITRVHDRLTDSTRVTAIWRESSRRFGLKSRAWLDVSFSYAGRRMTAPPAVVNLTLESFTPARGGWAFAHPRKLRMRSGKTMKLDVPAAQYLKRQAALFDTGRREMLSFQIPTDQLAAMVARPELELEAGNASFRFRARQMDMLRDMVIRMTTTERGP
jgi:hypothetical protein